MILLQRNDVFDKITRKNYKIAIIFEGICKPDEAKNTFEKIDAKSSDVLLSEMNEFCSRYPHKFTILFGTSGTQRSAMDIVNCNFEGSREPLQGTQKQINPENLNFSEMKEKFKAEIKAEFEEERKKEKEREEHEATKTELEHLKTSGGKLAFLAEQLLVNIFTNSKDVSGAMNGLGKFFTEEEEEVKGNPEMKKKPIKNINELELSLAKLVEILGEETIVRLARKIKPGNPIINIVKQYANE